MRITLLALCLCCSFVVYGQGSTTSDIKGRVTGPDGLSLIGANVVAVHLPSGTETGTATDEEGYYQLPGMKVGGPYTLRVTYVGYTDVVVENVMLRLGEPYKKDFMLTEANVELTAVTVVASSGVIGQSAGTSTQISAARMETVPSLNRDIDDYLRLTPRQMVLAMEQALLV